MKKILNSPVDSISFNNNIFYVKRDDLLHPNFSGNKARKFYYFLENDFPNITKVISYGSNQSNAMYSLSVLAKLKGWDFQYYTNHLSSFLEQSPDGNYKGALDNKMQVEVGEYDKINLVLKDDELLISEGGAIEEASYGIELLAQEIIKWKEENDIENLKIFLPSGTGTTALFLQKYLEDEVLTTPCVGDEDYLKKQFYQLETNEKFHPTIVSPPKKFHFGKLYKENYHIWSELKKQTNIEFDLLYDPIGWQTLLNSQYINSDAKILYIHQGGLKGNETMIKRYQRKLNID